MSSHKVSFGGLSDRFYSRKISDYVRSKVTFRMVARAYNKPYANNHNVSCWLHSPDATPSARIKKRGGREYYKCYTSCGYGDVIWMVGKLEGIEKRSEVIEFCDDYFGLKLSENVAAILGMKEPAQTDRDKFRRMEMAGLYPVEDAFIKFCDLLPPVTKLGVFSTVADVWLERDELCESVHAGLNFNVACERAASWIKRVEELQVKFQLMAYKDIINPWIDENGKELCPSVAHV